MVLFLELMLICLESGLPSWCNAGCISLHTTSARGELQRSQLRLKTWWARWHKQTLWWESRNWHRLNEQSYQHENNTRRYPECTACILLGTGPGMNWRRLQSAFCHLHNQGRWTDGRDRPGHSALPLMLMQGTAAFGHQLKRSPTTNTHRDYSNSMHTNDLSLPWFTHVAFIFFFSNPILMTPLTERPLAASTLWAAKQPSREHIMERACVS